MNLSASESLTQARCNDFITALLRETPPLWSSHLFIVFDLVVQYDPVGVLGLLPREGHAVPGRPVLPYDCDGGRSCRGREANRVYLCCSPGQRARFPFKRLPSEGLAPHQQRAAGLQPCYSCLGAPRPRGKRAGIFSSAGGLVARQQMVLICYYSVSNEIRSMDENPEQNSSATYLF